LRRGFSKRLQPKTQVSPTRAPSNHGCGMTGNFSGANRAVVMQSEKALVYAVQMCYGGLLKTLCW
jgi:hypothetical protein